MKTYLHFLFTLALVLVLARTTGAQNIQDVQNVDVKSLPQSEINKAKKAIQDAGLSPQEAIRLARQRGASEQQIMEFQQRLQEGDTQGAMELLPEEDTQLDKSMEQTSENTQRQGNFEKESRVFGSYLFNSKNLSFEPSLNIQTPKNYEISIGDQVLINIWGNSQNNYQLTVNPNGQLMIPDVGPLYIAGLSYAQAEAKIKERLTNIYADMGGRNPGTFAQINLGQLQSMQVNLVGEVNMPGTYTLPVTASVFNALYLSGGPSDIGSFRAIKIIRDNAVFKTIDIYKFLVDADPSDMILLKNADIIFVPPADKQVEVNGEFKRTGIFELLPKETLADLLRFAGGYTQKAYRGHTQIIRQTQQGKRMLDITAEELHSTLLLNGDSIVNSSIVELFENQVSIHGAVYRPGIYEWKAGMSLLDLIEKADKLTPDAYQNRGIITRLNPDQTTTNIAFDVQQVAKGGVNIPLHMGDSVLIKSHFDIGERDSVSISGEVMQPGSFAWSENTTVSDLIFMAGGFTEAADSTFIEISRRLNYGEASHLTDTLVHVFSIHHSRKLTLNHELNFPLQAYDHVSIKRAPGYRAQGRVSITGEVIYAGVYAIQNKRQRISDLIEMAHGITPQAYVAGAQLRRNSRLLGSETIAIDLKSILANPGSENDLFLHNGDIVHIPEFMQTVKVNGHIQNPLSITYISGQNARFYINQTGGFMENADKKKTYVLYANGYSAPTRSFLGIRKYPKVTPGSQVIVPEKPEKKPGNGQWIAVVGLLSSLALSAATIVNLTK